MEKLEDRPMSPNSQYNRELVYRFGAVFLSTSKKMLIKKFFFLF